MKELIKVLITGPESTGKSYLSAELAKYYHTAWVKEYAREYLTATNGEYSYKDLLKILEGQLLAEQLKESKAKKVLFCDTGPEVIALWSKFKFGIVDNHILSVMQNHKYDIVLLTNIDLPWQEDPLREVPKTEDRKRLFSMYQKQLLDLYPDVHVVSGIGNARVKYAIDILAQKFQSL